MACKVMNERWVGCHLFCDVVLDNLAILGVTACGSTYGESVKTWFNAAIPKDVRNEIEKAVLIVYHRGSSTRFPARDHASRRGAGSNFEGRLSAIAEKTEDKLLVVNPIATGRSHAPS